MILSLWHSRMISEACSWSGQTFLVQIFSLDLPPYRSTFEFFLWVIGAKWEPSENQRDSKKGSLVADSTLDLFSIL